MSARLTHGSLFSGMGGFDLAAQWAGWENIFHCEWKEFNQKILKYYWPEAITYNDITKSDFSIHRGAIDVLTGGFPCQPYSVAGKRKGKEDNRHLWPEMLRAIREIKPRWVVGENVRGLASWNGGLVFDEVQADLEAQGYEVIPFILPACAINAPHRRERIWFVAYSHSRHERDLCRNEAHIRGEYSQKSNHSNIGSSGSTTDTKRIGQSKQGRPERQVRSESFGEGKASWSHDDGRWPAQSPLCNGNDGLSSRLDGITFPKWRSESIMSGGNAIVPQVALEIFKVINQMESFAIQVDPSKFLA